MMKPRFTSVLLLLGSVGITLLGSCVKENEKAERDDARYWDYNVTLNRIFYDAEGVGQQRDIFAYYLDSNRVVRHTNTHDIDETYPAISHNFRRLAFVVGDAVVHGDMRGNDRIEIPHGAFVSGTFRPGNLSWSWRSNYLTFHDRSQTPKVYFAFSDYNQETPEAFTQGFKINGNDLVGFPTFYGEDNRICFLRFDGSTFYLEVATAEGYDSDAETPTTVYTSSTPLSSPRVSQQQDKITFTRETANGSEVCVIDIDGENFTVISEGIGNDVDPCFSPDGMQVVYASDEAGQSDLYTVNVDGSGKQNLTNTADKNEEHPFWK